MSDIQEIEAGIKLAKEMMAKRDMALKLGENFEFRKLVLEEFCVNECARLVGLSADPAMSQEQRADALSMAQAAGHLRRYFSVMTQMGNAAEHQLVDLNSTLEELRAEGAE